MKASLCSRTLFLICFLIILIVLAGCGSKSNQEKSADIDTSPEEIEEPLVQGKSVTDNPLVTITMNNDDQIVIELYPNIAPNTVNNFISLIEENTYNGLLFHRVIPDFMVQGGDPKGDGTGGPGYSIKGEFSSNGFENNLKHERGVISMARTGEPDSAGSQFFIMVNDSPDLDDDYAAFGEVIEGMEIVDEIVTTKTDSDDKPVDEQQMKTVKVDTMGHDFPKPETE